MKRILCIVGRTCSGKDTLAQYLIKKSKGKIKPFISFTDREMRKGETDGVEHYFLSKESFTEMMETHKPLAYTEICNEEYPEGCRYMTTVSQLDSDANLYIIDPNGVHYLEENFPDVKMEIIYIIRSKSDREKSAKRHRSDFEKFEKRCAQEDTQFTKFEEEIYEDTVHAHVIRNDKLHESKKLILKYGMNFLSI